MTLPTGLEDFAGRWALTRQIKDARAGQVIRAAGQASLNWDAKSLIYDETVRMRIPGQPEMTGTRRYLWKDGGDRIAIHFVNGGYFHTLNLGQSTPKDHHDCPPDSYDAEYDFLGWPAWSVRWIVHGPRKSYEMETKYTRC